MPKKRDRFACFVPVKPYVKRFLLTNYNRPDSDWSELIDLSADKELQEAFRSRLRKKGRWERRYQQLSRYTTQVNIEISKDDFYRYGWAMSRSEAVSFGRIIERRAKTMLYIYLDVRIAFGCQLSKAIRDFQAKFGFTEDDWSYDTIRREYIRHSFRNEISTEEVSIEQIIDKIVLGKLSNFGTISPQGLNTYGQIAI